jgi:hypothetical protein
LVSFFSQHSFFLSFFLFASLSVNNSKKYIEIEGACGGKGTEVHKACVVGDTVGDPFKDTSGPSLNILIKLMSIISLTIAPLLKGDEDWDMWYYGLIPLAVMVAGTYLVYYFFWRDGLDISAPVVTKDAADEKPKEDVAEAPEIDKEDDLAETEVGKEEVSS